MSDFIEMRIIGVERGICVSMFQQIMVDVLIQSIETLKHVLIVCSI